MTSTRTCVFTEVVSRGGTGCTPRGSVAGGRAGGGLQLRRQLASIDPAGGFGEKRRYVTEERAPHLQAEAVRAGAPQHHFGLGEHGARTHPRREGARVEIERAAGREQRDRERTADAESALAMTDVDK